MRVLDGDTLQESYFESLKLIIAAFFGAKISTYLNEPFLTQFTNLAISLSVALLLLYIINFLEHSQK